MKRLIFLSLLFLIFLSRTPVRETSYADSKSYYAKANDNVYFYSSPIKSDKYKLFEVPSSYYVLLLGNGNQDFYRAKYSSIEGFVLKSSVIPVNEQPNYPFANTSFRIFTDTSLYSSPDSSSNIKSLSALTEITTYYGKIEGQELLPKSTNIWYYCRYKVEENYYTGYVFSYYCDQLINIVPNTESYTPCMEELFKDDGHQITQTKSSLTTVLIVICCVVPCLIIALLLVKKKNSKPVAKRTIKRPKHDYFEFNEDDI